MSCAVHSLIASNAVYVNPDGLTGFGTPWEIAFIGNYTVRTKGGNVDGYSALFSFIPELKLSRSHVHAKCIIVSSHILAAAIL